MTIVAEAPGIAGAPQAQGDLSWWPWADGVSPGRRASDVDAAKPVTSPVVLVTGAGGHDHTLLPAEGVSWYRYPGEQQTLGVLVVADGATAVVRHDEHGENRIGPGIYVVRRQREQADEIRMVED
jgi:hypothetical protein